MIAIATFVATFIVLAISSNDPLRVRVIQAIVVMAITLVLLQLPHAMSMERTEPVRPAVIERRLSV